jgi:hypothetical protein
MPSSTGPRNALEAYALTARDNPGTSRHRREIAGSRIPLRTPVRLSADESVIDSGSVMVTAVAGDVFAGSFDVTLDTGEHLTGTFNPTACPSLNSVTPMPCM